MPSVILSAFQSVQRQKVSSTSDDDCEISRQLTTTDSVNARCEQLSDTTADRDCERCLRWRDSDTHAETRKHWRPLLLVIPLRLGLSEINPLYFSAIKVSDDIAVCRILSVLLTLTCRQQSSIYAAWRRCENTNYERYCCDLIGLDLINLVVSASEKNTHQKFIFCRRCSYLLVYVCVYFVCFYFLLFLLVCMCLCASSTISMTLHNTVDFCIDSLYLSA